jgi:lipoprotein NlpI
MNLKRITVALAGLVLCLSADVFAEERPAMQEQAVKEIKLEGSAFTRGEPVPNWVEEIKIPETQLRNPVVIRLADTQFNALDVPQTFVHRAMQVNQSAALGQVGQIQIFFVPEYEKLKLHSVRILRGKEIIDQTNTVSIHFLQRETSYENGVYSGLVTAALLLSDVRVGDVVEYKYSTTGANPVFGKKFLGVAGWDQIEPVALRSVILNHSSDRKIHWRMVGDFRNTQISPKVRSSQGATQLRFEEHNISEIDNEPYIPATYYPARILQFSEFQNWNEVAQWATELFAAPQPLPDELRNLLAHLRSFASEEDRVIEALHWVQSEIRYFSVSIGASSHRPYAPAQVVQRRYGDCKDKAYLLITLLRELGIPAKPVLLSLELRNGVNKLLPSPTAFDHVIVQATIAGKKYYLDGTQLGQNSKLPAIGSPFNGIQSLIADMGTTSLSAISHPHNQSAPLEEWREKIRLDKFGEDGTLELERSWRGYQAEQIRFFFTQFTPEQLRKFTYAPYEKRYPGIEIVDSPSIEDDAEQNRIQLKTKFRIPNLAVNLNGGWGIRFFPGILQSMFNVPENLKRNFPVAIPVHPYQGHYTLSLQWPESLSVVMDPSTERINGDFFDAQLSQSFRGNHTDIAIDFSTKASEIPAKALTAFVESLNKLNKLVGGMVIADNAAIKKEGLFGIGRETMQDNIKQRIKLQVERISKAIDSGRLQGEDLAEAYCTRATSLADMEKPDEGLKDAEKAVRLAPAFARAWACRGEINFDIGHFDTSISDFTKALSLGYDEFSIYYKRGQAKYFLGKMDEAAEDLQKAVDIDQNKSDQIYASLWLVTSLKKQSKPIPEKVQSMARQNPQGEWPRPALSMLLDILTPDEMQNELNRKKGDDFELSQVEAMYYLGQYYLLQGKTDLAIAEFRKLREKGVTIYTEHISAGFELRRLEGKL